jgi:hypothetical protein
MSLCLFSLLLLVRTLLSVLVSVLVPSSRVASPCCPPAFSPLPRSRPPLPPLCPPSAPSACCTTTRPLPCIARSLFFSLLVLFCAVSKHKKALELARQRDHVDGTINNMKHLLAMLEQERTVLDAALTVLIKQTTSQVGLARTASVAAFEDLLLSPPNNKMRRSASQQFNLDVIDTSSVVAPPRY